LLCSLTLFPSSFIFLNIVLSFIFLC
jgi:hypothetical protein